MDYSERHRAVPSGSPGGGAEGSSDVRKVVQRQGGPIITSLAGLEPRTGLELGTHGAILYSCADHLETLCDLRRAGRVQAACIELRNAVQDAAAKAHSAEEALQLAVCAWSDQLLRLARPDSDTDDALQLLADLRSASAHAQDVDPYGSIFEDLSRGAQALYDHHWPPVEFVVRALGASPAFDDGYAIRAATEPATAGAPSKVVLKIHPSGLGPEAFAAIPALVVHECVCHVATCPSGTVDNLSLFAEGFMDWAADYYRQLWLRDLGPLALPAEEHARRVFDSIAEANAGPCMARGVGRRAARKLTRRLEQHHGMRPGRATAATANLAVRLNVASASLVSKDRLVRELDLHPHGPVPVPILEVIEGKRDPIHIL